jgi:hypothetical protein
LKYGDRFYYESGNELIKLTIEQLQNIRKQTMSRILCNTISVDFIQKYTFFIANRDWNPLANCKNIPSIDLNLWRDKTNDENDEIRKNNTGKNKKIKN